MFMRLSNYFVSIGLSVSVRGKNTKDFFQKYNDIQNNESIDFEERSDFDYAICSGMSLNSSLVLARNGVTAKHCVVWAFGEAGGGLFENLAYGYGINQRFPVRFRSSIIKIYEVLFKSHFCAVNHLISCLLLNESLVYSQYPSWLTKVTNDKNILDRRRELIIPIPIPLRIHSSEHLISERSVNNNVLRVGWLGRISDDFKIYPLLISLDRVIAYCKNNALDLEYIYIGNGNAVPMLLDHYSKINDKGISIKLLGFMEAESAGIILQKEVDLMIGMGTAALDAASFGLPSVIVNAAQSFATATQCRYRWLYESKDFFLGEFIEGDDYLEQVRRSLDDVLDEFLADKFSVRHKCIEYSKNFYESVVFNDLHKKLKKSKITMCEIESYIAPLEKFNDSLRLYSNFIKRILDGFRNLWSKFR